MKVSFNDIAANMAAIDSDKASLRAEIDRITAERDGLAKELLAQAAEIVRLADERDRTARNRDMWKAMSERQAARLTKLHEALRACADARMPGEARRIALEALTETVSDTDAGRGSVGE